MYFGKIHHPHNFTFADRYQVHDAPGHGTLRIVGHEFGLRAIDHGDEVFHLAVHQHERWGPNCSQAGVHPHPGEPSRCSLQMGADGTLELRDGRRLLLRGGRGGSFGVCGRAWMWDFTYDERMRFYGMGEKLGPLEKTGLRTKFWNTDVCADFAREAISAGRTDPMYASVPWVIVNRGATWLGILLDDPYPAFCSAGGRIASVANQQEIATDQRFYLGADDGAPEVWIVVGPSLPELVRKYQRLIGTTPLPPVWALGHHQCRWGYESAEDLLAVEEGMRRYRIPNDGLWLDIDYMQDYKVFTWKKKVWKQPARQLAKVREGGAKVVPILDPGVKDEAGYPVRDQGLERNIFCQTPEGTPFIGFVWPGATLFPDFSREDACAWWAERVAAFAADGVDGAWLDMNDPAVGPTELDPMRFDHGRLDHAVYHNQYALGMARASRAGFLRAHPDRRPFLLTRSAFTGTQRYAAVWTGDNQSSDIYCHAAIPCTLNLALSGMPFNGPDVPGFGQDADPDLAVRWYKAGFLFPFLRNHSARDTRTQEPWTFGTAARKVIAHYVRLRYKLLPYLYNLFIDHEVSGEAIMRPLFYDFTSTDAVALDRVDDQYLLGPHLMHAPVLARGAARRELVLPAGRWFCARSGRFVAGGKRVRAVNEFAATPLYVRAPSLVPMRPGLRAETMTDLAEIEVHCFLEPGQEAEMRYRCDDGESFAYQRGERSDVTLRVRAGRHDLTCEVVAADTAWRPVRVRLVGYGTQERLQVGGVGTATRNLALAAHRWTFAGDPLACRRSPAIVIDSAKV